MYLVELLSAYFAIVKDDHSYNNKLHYLRQTLIRYTPNCTTYSFPGLPSNVMIRYDIYIVIKLAITIIKTRMYR